MRSDRPHQVGERPQHLVLGQAVDRVERTRELGIGRGRRRLALTRERRDRSGSRRPGSRAPAAALLRTSTPPTVSAFQAGRICSTWLRSVRSSSTSRQLRPADRIRPLSGSSVARFSSSARSASTKRCSPLASAAIRSAGASIPQPVQQAAPALGQRERDAQLVGDGEPEVLHRLERVGEVERPHRAQLHQRGVARPLRHAHLEPALERLELAQVDRHLLGRGDLAVEAAARLVGHVAAEQAPPLALAELAVERRGHPVLPGRHQRLGQAARLGRVHRVLERGLVEVEDQERDGPAVDRGREGDRTEGVLERAPQAGLDLVRVAQARERHVECLVSGTPAALHHQLLVACDLHDLLDHALDVVDPGVEEVGLREVVEGGARLTPGVRVRDAAAALEDPVVLLLEQRDAVGALRERTAREAPEQQRQAAQPAVLAPLAHREVLDRLDVVDRRGVGAEIEVQDRAVPGLGVEVLLDVLHHTREHDRKQGGVGEDAGGALAHAVERPVAAGRVGHRAHEDVVVVVQPLQELARRGELGRVAAASAQPRSELAAHPAHVLEVLDRQEDRLEQREHLVLDPPQLLARLKRLEVEQAIALLAALGLRVAEGHDALPLAPHREDRVGGGVHAQPGLLQVVLEAVEDEGPVRRVGAQDRGLERETGSAADPARVGLAQVGGADVNSGEALVELVRRRHLARDERIVERQDAGGDRLRRQRQPGAGRQPRVQDRRQRQHQLALLRRGFALEDLENLRQVCWAVALLSLQHRHPLLRAAPRPGPARRS